MGANETLHTAPRRYITTGKKMSDIFASTLFVIAIYCLWAIAVYKPQPQPATDPEQPIDYFPEVEDLPQELEADLYNDPALEPQPEPITIVERRPVAAFTVPQPPAVNLNDLSIRQLKAMAQERTGTPNAIKGYSRLTKTQLIAALS